MNLIVTDLASRETASIKSGAAHEIEFVIGDCALGKVLVARSPIGVCAIRFGSTAGWASFARKNSSFFKAKNPLRWPRATRPDALTAEQKTFACLELFSF
jgi:hypothetical protein